MSTLNSPDHLRQNQAPETASIDLTPMIDLVFLLLIFFMCVTEMVRVETESLTLPRAVSSIEAGRPAPREVVNVTCLYDPALRRARSDILIRRATYNDAERLRRHLAGRSALFNDCDGHTRLEVKIRADAKAPYQLVQKVMVACMKADVKRISFGIAPPGSPP